MMELEERIGIFRQGSHEAARVPFPFDALGVQAIAYVRWRGLSGHEIALTFTVELLGLDGVDEIAIFGHYAIFDQFIANLERRVVPAQCARANEEDVVHKGSAERGMEHVVSERVLLGEAPERRA